MAAQSTGTVEYTNCISVWPPPHTYECPGFDTCEVPVLEIQGIWSTPSLPLLPGPI